MSSPPDLGHVDLSESMTIPSDSENYDTHVNLSESDPPSTTSSPLILYSPPTVWSLLRGAAINLLLPFVNGLMLGFGDLFANEVAFRLGWSQTKVRFFKSLSLYFSLITGLPIASLRLTESRPRRRDEG